MIRLFIRLPLVLAILLPLCWVLSLFEAAEPEALLARAESRLVAAYPVGAGRVEILDQARRRAAPFLPWAGKLGATQSPLVQAGLLSCGVNAGVVLRVLPLSLLLMGGGICSGLVLRERMRRGEGYASPTAAAVGRGGVVGAILWLAVSGLAPIPAGFGWLYLAPAAGSLGAFLYVANLPLKL